MHYEDDGDEPKALEKEDYLLRRFRYCSDARSFTLTCAVQGKRKAAVPTIGLALHALPYHAVPRVVVDGKNCAAEADAQGKIYRVELPATFREIKVEF